MIVKGEVAFVKQNGVAEELIQTAIPCMCVEQAEALRQVLSSRD
jgi:hypothetical protein